MSSHDIGPFGAETTSRKDASALVVVVSLDPLRESAGVLPLGAELARELGALSTAIAQGSYPERVRNEKGEIVLELRFLR